MLLLISPHRVRALLIGTAGVPCETRTDTQMTGPAAASDSACHLSSTGCGPDHALADAQLQPDDIFGHLLTLITEQGASDGAWTPGCGYSAHQMEVQLQMAGLVAAAVHVGLISVHEGICDVIDASSPIVHDPEKGTEAEREYLTNDFAQRSRFIAEMYMDPAMPGMRLYTSCALEHSTPSGSDLTDIECHTCVV